MTAAQQETSKDGRPSRSDNSSSSADTYRSSGSGRGREIVRFLIAGGSNTVLAWLIYLLLLRWFRYEAAYVAAYVSSIGTSYLLSARFVFRQHLRWRAALLFPLVYAAQLAVGFVLLRVLVERLDVPQAFAPLLVVLLTLPITFLLSRRIVVARDGCSKDHTGG